MCLISLLHVNQLRHPDLLLPPHEHLLLHLLVEDLLLVDLVGHLLVDLVGHLLVELVVHLLGHLLVETVVHLLGHLLVDMLVQLVVGSHKDNLFQEMARLQEGERQHG